MDILLREPQPIPVHAMAALAAVLLGGMQLGLAKGTTLHVIMGRLWVGLLLFTAISSFFIHELRVWGVFSPIHLLSVTTIFAAIYGVYCARAGKIARHRMIMAQLYVLALLVAGAFTLLPGRVMHQLLMG